MLSARHPHLLRQDDGLTLVELVIVMTIIAILLAVTVASYGGIRERADESAAEANIRVLLPSITAYYADHETYATMTLAVLQSDYDRGIDPAKYSFGSAGNLTDTSYCVESTSGAETYRKAGPAADIVPGTCP
jgi:prepilin-type N-terminal cleavage/methylation domain-containing protein